MTPAIIADSYNAALNIVFTARTQTAHVPCIVAKLRRVSLYLETACAVELEATFADPQTETASTRPCPECRRETFTYPSMQGQWLHIDTNSHSCLPLLKPYTCDGCDRPETECSLDPCDSVLADRRA